MEPSPRHRLPGAPDLPAPSVDRARDPTGLYCCDTEGPMVFLGGTFFPRQPRRMGSMAPQSPSTSPRQVPALCPACGGY